MSLEHSCREFRPTVLAPTGPLIVPAVIAEPGQPELSLVVPTLNEAENIADFLAAVRRTLDACLPGRYEVIVVDDDSADGTGVIAAGLMESFPQLRVVSRHQEAGLAAAVIRGWQLSRGRTLGTINADFQHPPAVLATMWERHTGSLTVATRHSDGGGLGDWGVRRRILSWGANRIGRCLLPEACARVSDPLSGCYLLRREVIAGIELRPLGYKSLLEILVRGNVREIHECGYQMHERERGYSKVRALQPLQYLRHMLRLRAAARERKT